MAAVTHRIDDDLKNALDEFCDAHGLKQQAVIETSPFRRRRPGSLSAQ